MNENSPDVAKKYIDDVLSGKIITCKWVKLFCQRHVNDLKNAKARGLYFDEDAGARILKFFNFLKHSTGEFAGHQFILSDWQQAYLWVLFGWKKKSNDMRRFRISYLEIARKNGKALALDTPINTSLGWRTIGEIKTGDYVFNEKGNLVEVVATSEIMTNHNCYRITFEDGENIIADAGHLWTVITKNSRRANNRACQNKKGTFNSKYRENKGYYVTTTEQMKDDFIHVRPDKKGVEYKYRVPLQRALYYPEADLPLDPYVLGVWLGDGSRNTTYITCGSEDVNEMCELLKATGAVIQKTTNKYHNSFRINIGAYGRKVSPNPVKKILQELNIFDKKRIPDLYLRSSITQRKEILCGLMDTDGFCEKRGQCEFSQKDKNFVDDFSELLSSLGIKHSIREKNIICNKKICHAYSVLFYCDISNPCFKLKRKLSRLKHNLAPRMLNKSIINIEPVKSVPVKCIKVNSPSHLYLAGRRMTPTHNSTMSSGVALYLLEGDREQGAQIYSAATKREQAKIVHAESARMVRASKALSSRITLRADNMFDLKTNSKFEPLSSDYNSLDGLNIHGAIIDELHAHKTRDLWDVIETATGARRQPLIFAITTAGVSRQSICREQHDYLEKVLEGSIEDDSYCGIIFTLDENDNYEDENVWCKANPNLGISAKIDDIQRKFIKAKEMPAALNAFLRLHMNVWTQAETRWINPDDWSLCNGATDIEKLKNETCYGGLDLSSTTDLTAFVLKFPRTGDVLCYFWIPEDNIAVRERRDRVPFSAWIRSGFVETTPGNVIDYDYIKDRIRKVSKEFQGLKEIGYDPYMATQIAIQLEEEGFNVVPVRQGWITMSPALKELEKEYLGKELKHRDNPVLKWMAANLVVKQDSAGNYVPDKAHSIDRIDGIVALCIALSRQINARATESIYESRGLLTI